MNNGPIHILLVEDNIINQKIAEKILSRAGITFQIANNGQEAVAEFQANPDYTTILMDVHMPVMDGFEATAKIRELEMGTSDHVQIIAMTACFMDGDEEKCLQAGMDDYLPKPLDIEKLKATIKSFNSSKSG